MSRKLALLLAGALAFAAFAAHAEDPSSDGGLQAALSALATVDSALVTWTRSEPIDSEVKRSVVDAPPFAGETPAADPARGLSAEAAAQNMLAAAEQRLADLGAKIARRRVELVYGSTAPPESAPPGGEMTEEQFDVRPIFRSTSPSGLPLVGIPLAGMTAGDERLRSEELGCDPERLQDLVASELGEDSTATLDGIDGALVVRASQATLARVRGSIECLARIAARRVQLDVRAYRVTPALRSELTRLSDGIALGPEAEERLAHEGTLLAEETLVTGEGRVVRSFLGSARSYLAEVAGTASSSVDTIVRTLHAGFFVEALPRLEPERRVATISVRAALVRPRKSSEGRMLGSTVELPELDVARAATTATVPLGRTALVGGSFDGGTETPLAFVLAVKASLLPAPRVARIPASAAAAPAGEHALVALDKDTKAEIARLAALEPVIERALASVRAARERHVEVIDVRDLLVADTGALALPRLGIVSPSGPEDESGPSGVDPERLELLIKRSTGGDDAWGAPAWLGLGRGALLVRQTPGTLATVERLVGSLRHDRSGVVEVQAATYRVSGPLGNELSGPVSKESLERLDDSVKQGGATLVAGGFVVARCGERVSVLAGRERAFITGSTQLPGQGGSSSVALVRTGFRLAVRARLEPGGIALETETSSAKLRDLVRIEGANGTLMEPQLDLDLGARELLLADGAGFALVRARGSKELVVLVLRARQALKTDRRTPAALLAATCALLAGCPGNASPGVAPASDGTPHRIVAFTCGAVDILIALGELDRVVAVEEDCPVPGTEGKVKIRNDDHPGQVNVVQVEAIMALHPDLVIAKADLKEALDDRGMRMLWSPPIVSMESLPAFVDSIATALGMPEKGRALLEKMHAEEKEIRARTAALGKVRVYYENNGAGRTSGTGTIVDAMIRLAGGASIAGDDPRPNVNLSPEAVVAADPEVIILGAFAESVETVRARPGWERISAVKSGRVHKIPALQRYAALGTPRCVQGCEEFFVPWIHPELAGKAR